MQTVLMKKSEDLDPEWNSITSLRLKILLLQIFNYIRQGCTFRDEWCQGIVIPIPKPGKNSQVP